MPQRVRCISNLGAIPKVESELCPIRSKLSKIETTTLLLLIAFPWSLSQIWSTPIRVSLCFSLCYRESLLALLPSPRSNHNFVPFWESLLKSRPQCSCFKLPFEDLCLKLDSDSGKYLSKRLGEISLADVAMMLASVCIHDVHCPTGLVLRHPVLCPISAVNSGRDLILLRF